MKKNRLRAACAVLSLLAAQLAGAQENVIPVDATACLHVLTEVIAHTPQRVVGSLSVSAGMRSNIAGSPFDNVSYRCPAYFSLIDGKYYEEGYCEGVSPKGDRWMVFVSGDAQRGTWKLVSGTGVFEATKGSGEYVTIARFPEHKPGVAQLCHHITGFWGK